MELMKFSTPLSAVGLQDTIIRGYQHPVEPVEEAAPGLSGLAEEWVERAASGPITSTDDAQMAQHLHRELSHLSERCLTDQNFWQWLTTGPFRGYVIHRWAPAMESAPQEELQKPAVQKRFLGGGSLNGVSRNALARLFWPAAALHSDESGYELSDIVLKKQDLYQAVFERKLGLHKPLARTVVRVLGDSPEDHFREALKNLNHVMTTICVEILSEEELTALVTRCRPTE